MNPPLVTPWPRRLNGPDDTWAHALARLAVAPLLKIRARPNQVTAVRLLSGLAACAVLAWDARAGAFGFGVIWTVSALLDRVDGELARIGDMRSRLGHVYDYYADLSCTAAVFLAMGVGLRHGLLGAWAPWLGLDAGVCVGLCLWLSEVFEENQGGDRIWGPAWCGFHPDDALFLLTPLAWLGWLAPTLVTAAAVTTALAGVILMRLMRQRARVHPPTPT